MYLKVFRSRKQPFSFVGLGWETDVYLSTCPPFSKLLKPQHLTQIFPSHEKDKCTVRFGCKEDKKWMKMYKILHFFLPCVCDSDKKLCLTEKISKTSRIGQSLFISVCFPSRVGKNRWLFSRNFTFRVEVASFLVQNWINLRLFSSKTFKIWQNSNGFLEKSMKIAKNR